MGDFIASRWTDIVFRSYQHASLVIQSVFIATVIAIALAVLVTSIPKLAPIANTISTIGLTIPSFALLGILIPLAGIGAVTSMILVAFYAVLPILRNATVGLLGVDRTLIESAVGMGMKPWTIFWRVRLPLAWPIILTGLRVSTQMSMGIAAVAAYALGPGLGSYIFTGLAQIGGKNALNYALVGTIGIVIIALVADAVLVLIGRLSISKGIRA